MYAFIGLGQCGSNIADLFSKRGYQSIAINYSQKDLDSVVNINKENKLKLIGSEGVGKSRLLATQQMQSNWERVTSYIEEKFSHPSIEIIFIVFSTGGGSGSGIAPMIIDLIQNKMDKVIVACPILPSLNEVATSQLNTLDVFAELSDLDIAILPIDNEKSHSQIHKSEKYELINHQFVNQIELLLHYTEQKSPVSNLDKRDLLTIFNTKGLIVIGETNLADASNEKNNNESLASTVISSWEKSIYTNPEKDRLVRMGLVIDREKAQSGNLDLHVIYKQFSTGEPLDLFEGHYSTGKNKIITILSGLSWCENRLRKIEAKMKSQQERIGELLQEEKRYKSNLSFSSFRQEEPAKKESKSVLDILNKYKR